jgi:hypothetical protein
MCSLGVLTLTASYDHGARHHVCNGLASQIQPCRRTPNSLISPSLFEILMCVLSRGLFHGHLSVPETLRLRVLFSLFAATTYTLCQHEVLVGFVRQQKLVHKL